MKVFLNEVEHIVDDLIQGTKSREQIAFWASLRLSAHDIDDLEFEPLTEKKRIWRVITYLIGVDLKDLDGGYLHSIENFIEFKEKMNLSTPSC